MPDEAPSQELFHPIDSSDAGCPARLAEVRRTCPVSRAEREGYPDVTLVTTHADVAAAFRNWRSFQSIGADPDPTRHDATPLEQRTIIALDPPTHTWARRLNNLAMMPGAVEQVLPYLAGEAKILVEGFAARGHAELVGEWAEPLPSRGIARVLGLPEEDAHILHAWIAGLFTESAAQAGGARYIRVESSQDIQGYLLDQIARRQGDDAPDDAITRMIRYRRDDGSAFTDDEICVHIRILVAAGNETTTSLLSNLVFRLLEQPGLYERVAADRSLLVPAIEESLRLDAPLQVLLRRAVKDTTIGDTAVHAGEVIALSTISGNRDESVWGTDAEDFVVTRFADSPEASHMGFGLGVHHCVGAFLARQTTLLGVNALMDAIPSMHLEDGYRYENVFHHIFHRPNRLPVTFPV